MHKKDDTPKKSKGRYQKVRQVITAIITAAILTVLGVYLFMYLMAPLL